tara:strand:- start:260 stop:421 length:162 start_codon:yes stop_codon:yes gene_type:complete
MIQNFLFELLYLYELNKKNEGKKATIGYFKLNQKQNGKLITPILIENKAIFSR